MSHDRRNPTGWRVRATALAAMGAAMAGASLPSRAAERPNLGEARDFAVLAGSTVSSTGTTSVTGDVGVSPGTGMTGFPPATVAEGEIHAADAKAEEAHRDASLAYAFLKGMASIPANNLSGLDMGGMTLPAGTYTFNASAQLTGTLTLDAGGDSGALFVFQIGSTLTTASGAAVNVINGGASYDKSKVFWQVGSSATLGAGTAFTGNILAFQSISIVTGSSMTGNALALNGAVTMQNNAMTSPPVVVAGVPLPPAVPINLTAVVSGSPATPSADLSWNDASTNENGFRVFRRDGVSPTFVLVALVPSMDTAGIGGTVTYQDTGLLAATVYAYQVTAFSFTDGESAPSNIASIDTGAVVLAPINLTAVLSGTNALPSADLSWTDASDNETEFLLYRKDGVGPDFVLIATVPSPDTMGTDGTVTYQDPVLVASTLYTYRVTAFSATDGTSVPSNEAVIDTDVFVTPPGRFLDINIGRKRSVIVEHKRAHEDYLRIKGSFSVIDVTTSIPTVLDDMDPRADGCSIQVKGPGNIVLLTIPADDPNWRVSRKGVYRWGKRTGRFLPFTSLMINTRKSEFTLKSRRTDFGALPVNSITVTMTCQGATGSDTRDWDVRPTPQVGVRSRLTFPR